MLAALLLLACQPAFATKRVALVLGNAAYQKVAPLANPNNDAALVAAQLKDAGFDVVDARHDLTAAQTRRALRDFADYAADADIAVVYYAGHGMEVDGTNYLIPVDAKLERDTDVFDEALSLERILVAIEPAKQLRLVILDACRDNPFAGTMKSTAASRSVGLGLAKIEPASPNTLIAYSARAGSTAMDGEKDSPFTLALARYLTKPGLDVRKAFGFVRDEVLKRTGNRQEPFLYGSLGGEDLALVPAKAAVASNSPFDPRQDYELALQIGNKDALNAFLAQYPDGFYARLAKLQLDRIAAEDAHLAATERARRTEQERARLAAEGAQKLLQEKAEMDARAAEQAGLAAEKLNRLVRNQTTDAERKRAELRAAYASAENPTANRSAVEKVPAHKSGARLAALTPGAPSSDLARSLQTELRRVGCLVGAADGEWNAASQRSLTLFNHYAGTSFDPRLASIDALEAARMQYSRVCPPVCEHGLTPEGNHCGRIACADGSFLNEDNECERQRPLPPFARHEFDERLARAFRERLDSDTEQAVPPAGQMVCDSGGCRRIASDCHLEYRMTFQGGPREGGGGNVPVCR